LLTLHRKVMTNTAMKMPEKTAAKAAMLSIAPSPLTSSLQRILAIVG
jgi:hypothetical protein